MAATTVRSKEDNFQARLKRSHRLRMTDIWWKRFPKFKCIQPSNIDQHAIAVMRLQEQTGPKLGPNPVPLEPFGHQVAGQASMLSVDATTVCKPLIGREHHLYCTLPPQLMPFTPQYKGVLYVRLEEEEDGRLTLWGYHPDIGIDISNQDKDSPGSVPGGEDQEEEEGRFARDWSSGTSTPTSFGSEVDLMSAVDMDQGEVRSRPSSGCIVRVKQDGEYEVKAGSTTDNRFLISPDEDSLPQGGKDLNQAEMPTQPLNPWGLNLHTRLLDKMRKSQPSASGCPFLVLENVVARFTRPCILDLKVGSRLHGDGASQKKINSQSRKCNMTTSRTLGLRLCGMQVYQETTGAYKSLDKYYGRTLNEETFRCVLRDFLHNGREVRSELLGPILGRLRSLISTLKGLSSFRFYASSLLIMYDGLSSGIDHNVESKVKGESSSKDESGAEKLSEQSCSSGPSLSSGNNMTSTGTLVPRLSPSPSTSTLSDNAVDHSVDSSCTNGNAHFDSLVDVRMIDFAHTTHSGFHNDELVHDGPDKDYIWGLQNLVDLFSELQAEFS